MKTVYLRNMNTPVYKWSPGPNKYSFSVLLTEDLISQYTAVLNLLSEYTSLFNAIKE